MSDEMIPRTDDHDLFELADEAQIIAELQGRVTEKYVYEFISQGGRREIGLSYAGTNWALREYAKQGEAIRVVGRPEIQVDPTDPEYIIAVVTAQRFAVHPETGREVALDAHFGVKRQWKNMEIRVRDASGRETGEVKIVPDKNYIEKAISKAQRNAFQACMPVDFIKQMISAALSRRGKPAEAPTKPGAVPIREHPAKKSPQPATPPPPQEEPKPQSTKPAPSANTTHQSAPGSEVDSEHLRLCQQVNILAKKLHKNNATIAKKFLRDITLVDSTKSLSKDALKDYIAAISQVLNGKYMMKVNDSGNWEIHDDKGRLFPVFPEPVAKPATSTPSMQEPPPQPEPPKEEELF